MKKKEINRFYWGYRLRYWLKNNNLNEKKIHSFICLDEDAKYYLFRFMRYYEEVQRCKQLKKDFKNASYGKDAEKAKKHIEKSLKKYIESSNFYEKEFFNLYLEAVQNGQC